MNCQPGLLVPGCTHPGCSTDHATHTPCLTEHATRTHCSGLHHWLLCALGQTVLHTCSCWHRLSRRISFWCSLCLAACSAQSRTAWTTSGRFTSAAHARQGDARTHTHTDTSMSRFMLNCALQLGLHIARNDASCCAAAHYTMSHWCSAATTPPRAGALAQHSHASVRCLPHG